MPPDTPEIAAFAHDLRTALTVANGYAQLLRRRAARTEETDAQLRAIEAAIEAGVARTQAFLDAAGLASNGDGSAESATAPDAVRRTT